jgi:hypothetical protein
MLEVASPRLVLCTLKQPAIGYPHGREDAVADRVGPSKLVGKAVRTPDPSLPPLVLHTRVARIETAVSTDAVGASVIWRQPLEKVEVARWHGFEEQLVGKGHIPQHEVRAGPA